MMVQSPSSQFRNTPFGNLISWLRSGKPLIVLAGAGVSVESLVPGAADIVRRLKEEYGHNHPGLAGVKPHDPLAYAKAMEEAFAGPTASGARRVFLDSLLSHRCPSICHHRLAQLVANGFVPVVLTTNFDPYIEIAIFLRTPSPVQVHITGETLAPNQRIPDAVHVVKLHGDVLFEDLGNLESEMDNRLDRSMREQVAAILNGAALLVLGYGCEDPNVSRFLRDAAATPNSMLGGFYFAAYNPEQGKKETVQTVVRLMHEAGKPASVLLGTDFGLGDLLPAHDLLGEILRQLDIEDEPHPPFGLGISELSLDQRLPRHALLDDQTVPIPRIPVDSQPDLQPLVSELLDSIAGYSVVLCTDGDALRRKLVLAEVARALRNRAVYFSDRLAAEPNRSSLWNRLHHFTARQFGTKHRGLDPEQLLRVPGGAVIIWDDCDFLDFENLPLDDGYSGALHRLLDMTWREPQTGTDPPRLLLATFSQTPGVWLQRYAERVEEYATTLKPYRSVHAGGGDVDVANRWREATADVSPGEFDINALARVRKLHSRSLISDLVGGNHVLEAMERRGIIGSSGGRVLVLVDEEFCPRTSPDSLAALGRRLRDRGLQRTPHDLRLLLDAYGLLFMAESWEEAWVLLRKLPRGDRAASELKVMLRQWWLMDRRWSRGPVPAKRLKSSSRFEIASIALSDLPELRRKVLALVGGLEAPEQILRRAHSTKDIDELRHIADQFRSEGRDDLLAWTLAEMGGLIGVNWAGTAFPDQNARREALKTALKELLAISEELAHLNAANYTVLMRDNLATLYHALGDVESARRIHDELLATETFSALTSKRAETFGNLMVANLDERKLKLAETYFVLSGISTRDSRLLARNLQFLLNDPLMRSQHSEAIYHELALLGRQ